MSKRLPIAAECAPDYVVFSSFGNDSVALIQYAAERGLENLAVAYSNTGWSSGWWDDRVIDCKRWVESIGYRFYEIPSIGMRRLVESRKAWPRNGMQFCSYELKIKPASEWLESIDPEAEATCMVGVRREESRARSTWPEWVEESENHGGRSLWSPLAPMVESQRNELLERAGFEPLPHSSMECYPCVNANRADIKMLSEERVEEIARMEDEMGFTSNNKKRTFFRPYRHMGAVGIREVHKWAKSKRGKYKPPVELGGGHGCSSGMCAS